MIVSSCSQSSLTSTIHHSPSPSFGHPLVHSHPPLFCRPRSRLFVTFSITSGHRNSTLHIHAGKPPLDWPSFPKLPPELVPVLAGSVIFFLGLGIRTCSPAAAASTQIPLILPAADSQSVSRNREIQEYSNVEKSENVEIFEDEETRAAFESWKSKTYSLTVPLKVIALRSSVPPLWIKNFMQAQGRRAKLLLEFRGGIGDIFSELSMAFSKREAAPTSTAAADIVTLGDSWLSFAINNALIEPIQGIEDQEWFHGLSETWKEQ